jgi:hypothetical protein
VHACVCTPVCLLMHVRTLKSTPGSEDHLQVWFSSFTTGVLKSEHRLAGSCLYLLSHLSGPRQGPLRKRCCLVPSNMKSEKPPKAQCVRSGCMYGVISCTVLKDYSGHSQAAVGVPKSQQVSLWLLSLNLRLQNRKQESRDLFMIHVLFQSMY